MSRSRSIRTTRLSLRAGLERVLTDSVVAFGRFGARRFPRGTRGRAASMRPSTPTVSYPAAERRRCCDPARGVRLVVPVHGGRDDGTPLRPHRTTRARVRARNRDDHGVRAELRARAARSAQRQHARSRRRRPCRRPKRRCPPLSRCRLRPRASTRPRVPGCCRSHARRSRGAPVVDRLGLLSSRPKVSRSRTTTSSRSTCSNRRPIGSNTRGPTAGRASSSCCRSTSRMISRSCSSKARIFRISISTRLRSPMRRRAASGSTRWAIRSILVSRSSKARTTALVEKSYNPRVHFTGAINPGMSGGPAVTAQGKVAGINVAKRLDGELVSFLVPASKAAAPSSVRRAIRRSIPRFLREEIDRQLVAWQGDFYHALGEQGFRAAALGPYEAPESAAPWFNCWARTNADQTPKPRAQLDSTSCARKLAVHRRGHRDRPRRSHARVRAQRRSQSVPVRRVRVAVLRRGRHDPFVVAQAAGRSPSAMRISRTRRRYDRARAARGLVRARIAISRASTTSRSRRSPRTARRKR